MKPTIFITGVSTGLGQGLAEHYLQQGAQVLGCSRRTPENLLPHPDFRFQSCDLSQLETIADQLAPLLDQAPVCDLAILNAGILSPYGDLQDVSVEECKHVMDVNVWANKQVIDLLLRRYPQLPQLVVISSGAAVNGHRGWNAYSISKAAVNMLVKLYAQEALNTHFLAVAPGLIATYMQDVLCGLPADPRFPSLQTLKDRKGTEFMPTPAQLAPRLARMFERAPERVESGDFVDIRKIDWADENTAN